MLSDVGRPSIRSILLDRLFAREICFVHASTSQTRGLNVVERQIGATVAEVIATSRQLMFGGLMSAPSGRRFGRAGLHQPHAPLTRYLRASTAAQVPQNGGGTLALRVSSGRRCTQFLSWNPSCRLRDEGPSKLKLHSIWSNGNKLAMLTMEAIRVLVKLGSRAVLRQQDSTDLLHSKVRFEVLIRRH